MRKVKLCGRCLAAALCVSLGVFAAGCGGDEPARPVSASREEIKPESRVVTDSLGRTVTLPKEIKSAAITNAYNAELITAIGAIDRVRGVDYYIYQDQEGFKRRFTEENLIGSSRGGLNFEKIVELAPDVLILCENDGWETAEEKLRTFGIPVVVCNAYYTAEFFDNVKLLGNVFGKAEQAAKLSSYFKKNLDYIDRQLADVPERTVYFEYRTPGRTTMQGDYFHEMVRRAHGDNIFKDAKGTQIQLEDVVEKNPRYIVKVSEADVYSSYIPPSLPDMERIRASIVGRPGWDSIDAVRNGQILLLSHYAHGGASKLVGAMYIAKFLYPEMLPDLHPEKVFKTWVTEYQGLSYHKGHTYPAFAAGE